MALTADVAQRMINSSHAKARELGVKISTAIVDLDGRLLAFGRMDGSHWLSIDAAQAKALTGAVLQRDGVALQQFPAATVSALSTLLGRSLLATNSVDVIREDGRVIAGIGCSAFGSTGATDAEDAECAHAARDAYAAGLRNT